MVAKLSKVQLPRVQSTPGESAARPAKNSGAKNTVLAKAQDFFEKVTHELTHFPDINSGKSMSKEQLLAFNKELINSVGIPGTTTVVGGIQAAAGPIANAADDVLANSKALEAAKSTLKEWADSPFLEDLSYSLGGLRKRLGLNSFNLEHVAADDDTQRLIASAGTEIEKLGGNPYEFVRDLAEKFRAANSASVDKLTQLTAKDVLSVLGDAAKYLEPKAAKSVSTFDAATGFMTIGQNFKIRP